MRRKPLLFRRGVTVCVGALGKFRPGATSVAAGQYGAAKPMKSFTARVATWRQDRASLRELGRLSERELDDLGIGRADLRAVASGAPVTSIEVDAVVTTRLPAVAGSGDPMPAFVTTTHRPTSLAA